MKKLFLGLSLLALAACGSSEKEAVDLSLADRLEKPEGTIRIATFNASLYRDTEGKLVEDFLSKKDPQIQAVADIILKVDPDVLVINEIDFNENFIPLGVLRDEYLTPAANEDGIKPLSYPFIHMVESNTGLNPKNVDFDNNGEIVTEPGSRGYGGDSFGYGQFVGQYGMGVISKYPLIYKSRRTFKQFKWKDMPENLMPTDFYSQEAQEVFRLSSKNHVDLPVRIDGKYVHLLMMHPTPPAFDGPEDRNGKRNHDEIRFFADYISKERADYIYDDGKNFGGMEDDTRFVILGDLNADPNDGDSVKNAIDQLLSHEKVYDPRPSSKGAWTASAAQAGVNEMQKGPHDLDTADFRDKGNNAVGNLRLDYVLPSKFGLEVVNAGVFWPEEGETGYELVGPGYPPVSSDHRLVWIDVKITD